ncbi:Myb domain, plant [Sesbania bispinosa]|nr:Myb domain, plant [Sesbania bispinosa]
MYHSSHMHKTESKSNRANSSTDLATVGVSQHLRLKGQDSMNFQFQQHVQQMFDIPDSFFKSPEAFDSQNVTEITAQGGSTLQFRNSLETVHSFLSSDKDSTFCEMYSGFPCHEEPLYEHFTQEHSKLNFFYSQAEVACATSGNSASSTAPIRKNRIKWTKDLHEQFVAAVNSLGGPQKAKPKAVLLKMDSKSLTIFHVKSHLQRDMKKDKAETWPLNFNRKSICKLRNHDSCNVRLGRAFKNNERYVP